MYLDSQGNYYFPSGIYVGSIPAVTGNQTQVLVPGPGGRISLASISQISTGGSTVTGVTSFNGRTGDVLPVPGDYISDTVKEGFRNFYFTNERARAAISLTTFGTNGAATYNPITGIFNIPQYSSTAETDPIFTASVAASITTTNINNWNGAYSWGNHALAGYLTSFTETDPIWNSEKVLYYTKVESNTTFVTLSTTQTITGQKTFNSSSVLIDNGLKFKDNVVASAAVSGYVSMWFNINAGKNTLGLTSSATYPVYHTYDFPNANGTIALISDLIGYATETYVNTQISNLVNSAPAALNTLNELAVALGNDANFSTTITNLIGTKESAITAGTASQYWRGDKTWQTLPVYTLSGLGGVPTSRTLTINGIGYDLSADRSWTINSMVYPGAGIAVSTGSAWGTSITDNSTNWNTAYTDRMKWDGGATGLVAATGRTSLGLGTAATANTGDFAAASHTHSIANVTGLQTALDGKEPSITAGTTAQYWRGDKTWQTLPFYTLPIASATALGGIKVGTNLSIDGSGVLSSTDTNTTYANFTRTVAGLVPNPGGATTNRYLREDGTWVIPPDNDTIYVHPTTAGNKHIPSGGAAGQILRWSADGTAVWGADTDTNTWNANTRDVAGYVAAPGAVANKVWKTDASGNPGWRDDADTVYSLPTATGTVLGGVKIGNGINISSGVISNYIYDTRNTRGATRLYRRDDDSDYSVQTHWTGTHWFIRGYNGDTFHAEARVGYSDSTGSVAWTNVSGRPTAVSSFTNDSTYITSASNVVGLYGSGYGNSNFTWNQTSGTFAGYSGWASYLISNHGDGSNYYNQTIIMPFWGPPQYSRRETNTLRGPYGFITDENIGGQSVAYASSAGSATDSSKVPLAGGTMSGRLTINTGNSNNLPLYLLATQPYIQIEALGASNTTEIRMYPTTGYQAWMGNYGSGELVLVGGNTGSVYINSNSIRVAKYRFNGNSTLSGNGTPEIVDMASVGMAMQALNYRWYNSAASSLLMSLDTVGNLSANAFYETSDIRYKNIIETNPSLTLDGLDVIKFTRPGSNVIRYGYSAQQVKSLSEDLIGGTVDELTVNYSDVHTLKIAALEKRITELESKLNI